MKKVIGATVANFVREHIITRFGIPRRLISDNGTPFINKDMKNLTEALHQAWKVYTILLARKWPS